jgi:tripartite-type tricarboxylate transporter receptor subunit TctC
MFERTRLRTLLTIGVLAFVPVAGHADEPVSFKGQRVTILIGYGVGGSYDIYGRLAARFLGKYLPGNPTVIAQSMTGAGSLTAATHLYNVAPKDGTVLGVIGQTIPVDQVLGEAPKTFDSSKFAWIGRIASGIETVISWHTVPVKTIEDVKNREVVVAASGPSSGSAIYPTVLNNLVGTKFKVVQGYTGTKEMMIAMERGEAEACGAINVSTLTSEFPTWLPEKKVNVLTQVSLNPHPQIPDVPTIVSLTKNEQDREAMKLFAVSGDIGRSIVAPRGLSPERVKVLRDAFDQMVKDPELLALAEKTHLDISPLQGTELQKLVQSVGEAPKAVIEKALAAKVVKR